MTSSKDGPFGCRYPWASAGSAAGDVKPYTSGRLNSHLKHALCTVDWSQVVLPSPIQQP